MDHRRRQQNSEPCEWTFGHAPSDRGPDGAKARGARRSPRGAREARTISSRWMAHVCSVVLLLLASLSAISKCRVADGVVVLHRERCPLNYHSRPYYTMTPDPSVDRTQTLF